MSSPFDENLSGLAAGVVENPENLNTTQTQNSNQLTLVVNNIALEEQQRANHDPEEEVVVELSPRSLMMRNRYVCEVCHKGFQREQNLQLHRRGHNLPWKLKTTKSSSDTRKKVYLCPEASCPHHFRSRALGDMTGVKKHFLRKHCEKKYECPKCTKRYAVLSDLKAHLKNCGSNTYTCNCGLLFTRRDTFRTHKGFCEALTAETERVRTASRPHHETSSEDSDETMVKFYESNISPPLGFQPVHRHQMSVPHLPGFNHHQLVISGLTQGFVPKNEPMNVDFRQASPLAMSRAGAMQNNHQQETGSARLGSTMSLFQTVNMIGGGSVEDMTGSTIMSQLQLGGTSGHNVAPPAECYYYDLLMGTHEERETEQRPTRDFLCLSVGNGGGASNYSTNMDDFIVSLGGTTNVNSGGFRGCGGGGVNVYSEGGEWVPGMAKVENADQMYGFYGGPSS